MTPIGFNFYDDPTHIRPYNKKSYENLFQQFSIKYIASEPAIFFFIPEFYGLNKLAWLNRHRWWHLISKIFANIYRPAVFIVAIKK